MSEQKLLQELHVVVVVSCSSCSYRSFRSSQPGDPLETTSTIMDAEVIKHRSHGERHGERPCPGTLNLRRVECSGDLSSLLYRSSVDVDRYRVFLQEEKSSVLVRASLLGVPADLAATLMFAERERQVERERTKSPGEYVVGLGSTAVAGCMSANINVQPQVVFRPERLEIPPEVARDFLITDIKVGKNSQLVSTGALPGLMFTENAFGVRLKMDTAQISMFVTISVTNQNPNARNFQGGLVGPAVE